MHLPHFFTPTACNQNKKVCSQKICPKQQIYQDNYSGTIQYRFERLALELKYFFLFWSIFFHFLIPAAKTVIYSGIAPTEYIT